MHKTGACLFFCCLLARALFGQTDTKAILTFDFNDHQLREVNDRVKIKPVGVTLTEDRFGNKNSAVYVHGHATSYINLGTSDLLKPKIGTISLWVNLQENVQAGKGFNSNPFLIMRNGAQEDFNIARGVGYNTKNKRLGWQETKNPIKEVLIFSKDTAIIGKWYHLLITSDNDYLTFYLDGELQGKSVKGFESVFLEGDSVILGRCTGEKNERYAHAIFDDIRFYNRVLTEKEILDLHDEPNPNRINNILSAFLKYGAILIALLIVLWVVVARNNRNLKKQREYYEMNHKIKELEIKIIKTQMNPHFISNCLSAIQNLIYSKEIEKAGEYLAKFSFFLRQVLDYSDKTYIRLEEELAMIKLYVELEQLRFKNSFAFNIHIDEKISQEEALIPSLITQVFIENAIWHGLMPLDARNPILDINITSENKSIFIEIKDNGVGRSNHKNLSGKNSRGTKLAIDKIESINQQRNSSDFRIKIVDLFDGNNLPAGTKIIIELLNYSQEE